jgi:Acetyltransferases
MKKINEKIFLRPVELPQEEDFWRKVFFDSVEWHFAPLALPENQMKTLLETQYQAQMLDYGENYPQAENSVIMFEGERAGRVIASTEHNDIHLIDLAVLSRFRNRGIGTAVLKYFFEESRRLNLPIRFYVEKGNRAFRLYERLGFRIVADVTSHFQMQWTPNNG